jgi:hypothetical protein
VRHQITLCLPAYRSLAMSLNHIEEPCRQGLHGNLTSYPATEAS